jgi:hypothetical protein
MKVKLNTVLVASALIIANMSTANAADIGTVLCEGNEIEMSVSSVTWGNWWNYDSIAVFGIDGNNKIYQLPSQRLHPYTGAYLFHYSGSEIFDSVKVTLTSDPSNTQSFTCN